MDDRAREFWDERAQEDAMYFVDNRLSYKGGDESFWSEGEGSLDALLDAVDARIAPEDHVVDIGCGVGRLTRVIAARANAVTGIDVSPRMLVLARQHNDHLRNVTWLEGDGVSLSGIPSESADACISFVVFQHIPDPRVVLDYVAEMGRVLKPGGWAAFQVSNNPAVHTYRLPLRERLRSLVGRGPKGMDHANWRGSSVDLGELRSTAERAGMTVERVAGEGEHFCLVRTRKIGSG